MSDTSVLPPVELVAELDPPTPNSPKVPVVGLEPYVVPWFHYAVTDATGTVTRSGRCLMAAETLTRNTLGPGEQLVELDPQTYGRIKSGERFALVEDALVETTISVDIQVLRTKALEFVDRAAERARLRFITTGAGQMLEYQETEREAREFLVANNPDIEDYPFLFAESQAMTDALGATPPPAQIAQEVIGQAQAWKAVGAQIKRLRRAAKMTIENATTPKEIAQARRISWPMPPSS